jgi:hypothetical protein
MRNRNQPGVGKFQSSNSPESKVFSQHNQHTHIFLLLIVLGNVFFTFIKFPNYILSGAMWAEMGVNYYPNSRASDLETIFFSKDAGYIPFGLRLLSWIFRLLGISAGSIPYVYSVSAILGASFLVGFFCLKRFRIFIPSDFVRFILALFVIISADFETRTYINFSYFAIFFVFINVAIMYKRQINTYILALFLVLIITKPILLAILPILIFSFLSSDRNKIQKLIFSSILVSAMMQILTIINSNSEGVFSQGEVSSSSSAVKNLFTYFFGTFMIPMNQFFPTSVGVKVILGIASFTMILSVALIAKNQLSVLTYFALTTLFCITAINTVAVSGTFSSNYTLLSSMPLFRYMVPVIDIGVLLLASTLINMFLILSNYLLKDAARTSWEKITNISLSIILSYSIFIASSNLHQPVSPALFNSQWVRMSTVIESGDPVCVPIDPAGWTYGRGCRLLNSDFNWISFGGYSEDIALRHMQSFTLNIPENTDWSGLQSIGMLVKPSTNENLRLMATLRIELKNNEIFKVNSIQDGDASGFLLFFQLPERILFSNISSMSFEASSDLFIGTQSAEKPQPAILWYGD